MLIIIDNFDSFTYNIVHAFEKLGLKVTVFRNNSISLEELFDRPMHYLVIGPGPGNPEQAGISIRAIEMAYTLDIPVLGICLGHQAIAQVFGGSIQRAHTPMHGKLSAIYHSGHFLFKGLSQGFLATRYHSLIVQQPADLEVIAWTQQKEIMGLTHPNKKIMGVQFHPESVACPSGVEILKNFLF